MISREFLELLACPEDKAPLKEGKNALICTKCGREYAVKEGIPVLLAQENKE
jgi:uncharacterized protein YbaR (Trm112 family)